jgi:hypothetical protein
VPAGVVRSLVPHLVQTDRPISSAIYGTVSVLAIIVAAAHDASGAGGVLVVAAVSAVVVWAIHVYAAVLAEAGTGRTTWRAAFGEAIRGELGVLEGASAPLLVLLLGAVGLLDDHRAIWWAVLVGVVLLSVMPIVWLRRTGAGWLPCLLASLVACLFGTVLIVMKVLAH